MPNNSLERTNPRVLAALGRCGSPLSSGVGRLIKMKYITCVMLFMVFGCVTHRPLSKDSWWSDVPNGTLDCHWGERPTFLEVASLKLTAAEAYLIEKKMVRISQAEAISFARSKKQMDWENPYLVRALRSEPRAGLFTVDLCPKALFVGYTTYPGAGIKNSRRTVLVVDLPYEPEDVSINWGEGIP
jgi:hypothetical protein